MIGIVLVRIILSAHTKSSTHLAGLGRGASDLGVLVVVALRVAVSGDGGREGSGSGHGDEKADESKELHGEGCVKGFVCVATRVGES